MNQIAISSPDADPALERALIRSSAQRADRLAGREQLVELAAAISFLAVAVLISTLIDSGRSPGLAVALALVGAYAVATRIEFHVGSVWADPTQLVFVPMLFLLPAETVPLYVAAGLLLGRTPEYVSGTIDASRVPLKFADAWSSIGPALVIALWAPGGPDWAEWPAYVAALASQFALDFGVTAARLGAALGTSPRELFADARSTWLVDALLAPVGLLTAFAAAEQQWAFLLVLPLMGLIAIFAREREARIESALALSDAYRGTAVLLSDVLADSDEYTGKHSRSVVVLAHQVAESMRLDAATLRQVEFGALLHDIGKIGVPNEIIRKPGRLTDTEMEVMRRHTLHGEAMLRRIGGVLEDTGLVVRSHHERWDGTGYPDGLRGEEIPIAARVVCVCDAFHAMTSDRPYRAAMRVADALAELRRESGRQFDPAVVAALIAVVETWDAPGSGDRRH